MSCNYIRLIRTSRSRYYSENDGFCFLLESGFPHHYAIIANTFSYKLCCWVSVTQSDKENKHARFSLCYFYLTILA